MTKRLLPLALAAFAVMLFVLPLQQTSAQSPDCWSESDEQVVVGVNPFTMQAIYGKMMVYDTACNTINDGRVNSEDRASEAAIYCTPYGVDVYDLDMSGRGEFLFRATWDEINRVDNPPAENTLIDGEPGFALYRLTSGEMQLNGPADWEGKIYEFVWSGCTEPEPETAP